MATTFQSKQEQTIQTIIRNRGHVLEATHNLDRLVERMSGARVVMLGEASHGTHEYYTWRTYLTKKLIREHGFNFIAVEGDWPDCYQVNRFVKHKQDSGENALEVLRRFDRWPTWMWANWEVAALADWLHQHNQDLPEKQKAGFYGLDVYSLWDSLKAVKEYLRQTDGEALQHAEKAFRCFAPYRDDETSYAYAAQVAPQRCHNEVVALLQQLRDNHKLADGDEEQVFSAEQNALIAVNAEAYYRTMIQGGAASWNVRDSHMAETLDRLLAFHGPESKAIVWEHNTHIGDARATSMQDEGMYNIGELGRKAYGEQNVFLAGFGSYSGTVIAASNWGAKQQVMEVPEAREGSWEYHLHQAGGNRLLFSDDLMDTELAERQLGHRAIGVVYRPQYERHGNYVPTVVPRRYDAFMFIDQTKALHPLHGEEHNKKVPDTYPFGV